MKRTLQCRICGKEVAPRPDNSSFPFCSARCRQVDLGKWLGEEYRVAATRPQEEQEDELPPMNSDGEPPKIH